MAGQNLRRVFFVSTLSNVPARDPNQKLRVIRFWLSSNVVYCIQLKKASAKQEEITEGCFSVNRRKNSRS